MRKKGLPEKGHGCACDFGGGKRAGADEGEKRKDRKLVPGEGGQRDFNSL